MSSHWSASAPAAVGAPEAEVERAAPDALGGVFGTPCPEFAVGTGELDAELLGRHRRLRRVERQSPAGHVPEPPGRRVRGPERVEDVLPARPGFPPPERHHQHRGHLRTEPGERVVQRHVTERGRRCGPAGAPAFEQDRPRLGRPGGGFEVGVLRLGVEGFRTSDGGQDVRVGGGAVGDLVGDRPARGRGRPGPVRFGGVEGVEFVPFGDEIREYRNRFVRLRTSVG